MRSGRKQRAPQGDDSGGLTDSIPVAYLSAGKRDNRYCYSGGLRANYCGPLPLTRS
jgi:hypothetical protein